MPPLMLRYCFIRCCCRHTYYTTPDAFADACRATPRASIYARCHAPPRCFHYDTLLLLRRHYDTPPPAAATLRATPPTEAPLATASSLADAMLDTPLDDFAIRYATLLRAMRRWLIYSPLIIFAAISFITPRLRRYATPHTRALRQRLLYAPLMYTLPGAGGCCCDTLLATIITILPARYLLP